MSATIQLFNVVFEAFSHIMMARHRLQLFVALFFILFSWWLTAPPVSAEMRIFELQHRPVNELAELVRSLLGEGARVAAYRNTLAVNATPAALDEVATLVATYDRPKQMLRIIIEQGKSSSALESEVSVSGRLQNGENKVVLGPSGQASRGNKSSVLIGSGQNRLKVRGHNSSERESRQFSQFVSVLEGEPALISVGRAVPFTSQMLSYCRHHPEFITTTSYEHVDTGFEVLPEVYNDMVELEVRPFMAFLDPHIPQQIIFQELGTKVSLPFDTWYELGGHGELQDGLSREILGGGTKSAEMASSVRIKVESR